MTVTIAIVIEFISSGERDPSLRINSCVSTPRSWRVSTLESLLKPLSVLGFNLTCHKFPTYQSFQSVIGATSLMGNTPILFELMTTAGLIFLISVPRVGSKLTSQISPRCGEFELVINNISSHQFPPFS
jgi:hypothetical protein